MTNDTLTAQASAIFAQLGPAEQQLALEALQRYQQHTPHGGPMMWLLGIQYTDVRPGYAACYLDVTRAMHNPAGIAHGGVAYTLVDTAMGAAFYNALERPLGCATIELKINYLRPVVAGRLFAVAELIERTSRFGLLTSRVTDSADRLIALAQGTFAIVHPRPQTPRDATE